jgi:transcriptional regulator with XRE-family HTH domain
MANARDPQPVLGDAIRRIRHRTGLSQEELAYKAELHPTGLSKIERGHSNPAWSTVRRIARALDVTLVELVLLVERIELE